MLRSERAKFAPSLPLSFRLFHMGEQSKPILLARPCSGAAYSRPRVGVQGLRGRSELMSFARSLGLVTAGQGLRLETSFGRSLGRVTGQGVGVG